MRRAKRCSKTAERIGFKEPSVFITIAMLLDKGEEEVDGGESAVDTLTALVLSCGGLPKGVRVALFFRQGEEDRARHTSLWRGVERIPLSAADPMGRVIAGHVGSLTRQLELLKLSSHWYGPSLVVGRGERLKSCELVDM